MKHTIFPRTKPTALRHPVFQDSVHNHAVHTPDIKPSPLSQVTLFSYAEEATLGAGKSGKHLRCLAFGGGFGALSLIPFYDVHEDREGLGFHLMYAVVVAQDRPSAPPRVQESI